MMPVREEIMSTFRQVAKEQGRRLAPLTDELKLTECGLDSLGFVLVVGLLEKAFNVDPFDSAEEIDFPITLRDFIVLYERHAL
jgi:acyl carrier protein